MRDVTAHIQQVFPGRGGSPVLASGTLHLSPSLLAHLSLFSSLLGLFSLLRFLSLESLVSCSLIGRSLIGSGLIGSSLVGSGLVGSSLVSSSALFDGSTLFSSSTFASSSLTTRGGISDRKEDTWEKLVMRNHYELMPVHTPLSFSRDVLVQVQSNLILLDFKLQFTEVGRDDEVSSLSAELANLGLSNVFSCKTGSCHGVSRALLSVQERGDLPAASNTKSILDKVRPTPLLWARATMNEFGSRASKPAGGAAGAVFSVTVSSSALGPWNSYSNCPTV